MPENGPGTAQWTVDEIFDPQSAQFLSCPYAAYAKTRATIPVAHHGGFDEWIVTGREELLAVLREDERLTSRHNLDGHVPLAPRARAVLERTLFFQPALYNVAGPEHSRFRTFISEYFTPRGLRALEPSIRAIARDLAGGLSASGTGDLLKDFAYPLPYTVIGEVIGIPTADRATVKEWNNAWLALQVVPLPEEQQTAMAEGLLAYEDYLRALLLSRAGQETSEGAGGTDLASGLYRATLGDEPLCTLDQAIVSLRFMIAAGHETTTNLIANAVHQLLAVPERWQALAEDHASAAAAVEETLRYDSSVQGALRVAAEQVRIGDVDLPAGSRVRVMFAAAGRDPAQFQDPDEFRLDREGPPRHLGFGFGAHFCVGAPLARLEARIALETLAAALPGLRLADDFQPEYLPGGFIFHALAALPVAWSPRDAASGPATPAEPVGASGSATL
ncbi:cytochrome P450 [Protofrankia symbiont of Coriaria ruscifolia]|uniref:cytochrome P450 n=1 Tax=Protofrankia symbiont of Coriaria ruscifolia TaxID=1306542 RepID=UPI0010414163|nr:cytochrome P450 [Protofrankia symbiont of Coriaria ruscifolia]